MALYEKYFKEQKSYDYRLYRALIYIALGTGFIFLIKLLSSGSNKAGFALLAATILLFVGGYNQIKRQRYFIKFLQIKDGKVKINYKDTDEDKALKATSLILLLIRKEILTELIHLIYK